VKAKRLLEAFGGLRRIRAASEDDLAAVRGIAPHEAAAVYRYFRREEEKTK
jgi:ERCC4-type nuclease